MSSTYFLDLDAIIFFMLNLSGIAGGTGGHSPVNY